MSGAMALWPVDDAAIWSSGSIGLGCRHLASVPEALGERLPLHHPASGLTLTAGARLDNRPDLLHHLKINTGRAQTAITDSEIILHAFQRWGEDCVTYLDGDWHFAIWDEQTHKLTLARDKHGNSGLYYFHGSRYFAFGSSKKALLALDAIPKKPELLRIAQVLTSWPGDGVLTSYEHILRLPPAHRMTISPDGIKIDRYWSPEHVPELRLKSDDEYVDALLEVFTQAVSARLRRHRPLGVTLSGGLDSGSVTAVAAGILRKRGENLTAFTSTPLEDPSQYMDTHRFGDETQLAKATSHQAGNVEHVIISAAATTPMAGIERMLWVHDEPGHAASNQFWIAALLEAARKRDVGVLLTGQMGNATISWAGFEENLYEMLLHGDVAGFRRKFNEVRSGAGLSLWHGARRYLLKPLVLPLWEQAQKLRQRRRDPWLDYSAIHPQFASTIELSQQMAAAEFNPMMHPTDPMQYRLRIIQPGQSVLGARWFEKGSAYGMEVRDPTQDWRVIELSLAIPESQYRSGGVDRWLIRRAMQGYLPDIVRMNTKRGLQAADLAQRVLANRSEVLNAIARLRAHDLARQVLDLPRIANVMTSLENGVNAKNAAECGTILLRGLMTGLFLLRF